MKQPELGKILTNLRNEKGLTQEDQTIAKYIILFLSIHSEYLFYLYLLGALYFL